MTSQYPTHLILPLLGLARTMVPDAVSVTVGVMMALVVVIVMLPRVRVSFETIIVD